MFQSRWNLKDWQAETEPARRPRVLFLADRNILVDQAYNEFSAFENASPGSLVRIAPDEQGRHQRWLSDSVQGKEPLAKMQKAIQAENSDLFDVLAYVAYVAFAAAPETRARRADVAGTATLKHFNDRQQAFLDFVLRPYVTQGVDELDADKLTPLLRLKYSNAIADAVADLGSTTQIRSMFAEFQKYLYAATNERRGFELRALAAVG